MHPGRNGYLWFLERGADSIGFVDAGPYVYQDVFTSIDPDTGRPEYDMSKKPGIDYEVDFCPSLWGGKDWPPAAFNPESRLLFIPANENVCSTMAGEEAQYSPGRTFIGRGQSENGGFFIRDGAEHIGELQAWNVDTGEEVWTTTFESHNGVRAATRATWFSWRHQRPLLPRFRREHRRDALALPDEFRNHRSAFDLCHRRQTIYRRAKRLGRRRPARAESDQPGAGNDLCPGELWVRIAQ